VTPAGVGSPAARANPSAVRFGDDSLVGVTRRVLLIGGRSVAPNAFVLTRRR
jgi:hypothetical protein